MGEPVENHRLYPEASRAFAVTALIRATTASASYGAGLAQNNPLCTSITKTAVCSGIIGFIYSLARLLMSPRLSWPVIL